MGILQRLFSSSSTKTVSDEIPTSFLECFYLVQNWSAKVSIDPDFDMNDKQLKNALDTRVTCPYCSAHIRFGDAVKFEGVNPIVKCPVCHTVTKKEKHYEYG